jgi:hypothetical protein
MEKLFTLHEVKKKEKLNVYEYFSTMVENSTTMIQQFVEIDVLF